MSISVRNVRKTLVSAMDFMARNQGISREKLLLSVLEQEFANVEQRLIYAEKQNASQKY